MVVICQDRIGADIDGKDAGEELHSVDNPGFTMGEILLGNGIESAEERPADATGITMVDPFFIVIDISASW